jgi:hypothetical protein
MGLRTFLLYVLTVAAATRCECAILGHEARPIVETDLQLTADDSDSGNWTANLGDIEVRRREFCLPNKISEFTFKRRVKSHLPFTSIIRRFNAYGYVNRKYIPILKFFY